MSTAITRRGISALGAGVLAVLPATPASAAGGLDPSYGTNGTAAVRITMTFGKGGTQVVGAVNRDYKVSRVAIGADGVVFLLGQFTDLNPDGSGGEARVALHKLSPDGKGVPGFGFGV